MDKGPDIDDIFKNAERATDLKGSKNILVFVGKTGSGKSTLSKFMRKDVTLIVVKNEQGMFMFSDNDVTIGSSDCLKSKTFYPNIEEDAERGCVYVDCAGFEDTRSWQHDLVAAFMNKKLLNSAEKMMIILVENYTNLIEGNDRTAFINNLKHTSALIKDNIDSFEMSIGLIATKKRCDHSDEQAGNIISKFLKKTERHLQDQKSDAKDDGEKEELSRLIKLVAFINDEGNFSWFSEPVEDKSPWEQTILRNNYEQIDELLFQRMKFSTTFTNEFQDSVSLETVNIVIKTVLPTTVETFKSIIKQIEELVMKSFELKLQTEKNVARKVPFAVDYCEIVNNCLAGITKFEDFEKPFDLFHVDRTVWDDLQFQVKKLRFLHGIAKSDLAVFERDAASLCGWRELLLAHVDNTLRFCKFLALLLKDDQTGCYKLWSSDGSDLSVDTFNIFVALMPERMFDESTISAATGLIPSDSLVTDLNAVLKACTPKKPDVRQVDKTIVFSSENIILSSIAPAIRENNNKMEAIVIKADKILYVDCGLKLQNTHLYIKATEVIVHKSQRTFHLIGENGAFHPLEQAEENTTALNGNSGFSSGTFRLIAERVKNAHLLHIHSVGGNGSDGQHGCDGQDAKTPPVPDLPSQMKGIFEDIIKKIDKSGYKVYIEEKGEENMVNFGAAGPMLLPLTSSAVGLAVAAGASVAIGLAQLFIAKKELKTIKVVNEDSSLGPTNGGSGGNAGAAATTGEIELVIPEQEQEEIKIEKICGKPGNRGSGGMAGSSAPKSSYKMYQCKVIGKKNAELNSTDSTGDCRTPERFPEARPGMTGAVPRDLNLQYKFPRLSPDYLTNVLGVGNL